MNDGIRIQDYILDDIKEDTELAPKRAATVAEYGVVLNTGCDFVISKKTKTTEEELVMLCSQKQFYIKKIKGGDGMKPLTEKTLLSFCSKMQGMIPLPETCFECLPADKKALHGFYRLLTDNDKTLCDTLKTNTLFLTAEMMRAYKDKLDEAEKYNWRVKDCREYIMSLGRTAQFKRYFKEISDIKGIPFSEVTRAYSDVILYPGNERNDFVKMAGLSNSYIFDGDNVEILEKQFGAGGVYDFLKMLLDFDYPPFGTYGSCNLKELFELPVPDDPTHMRSFRYRPRFSPDEDAEIVSVKYNPKDFFEYLTYQPQIQGYDPFTFVNEWADTLVMEQLVFGKITDKYPKHLASLHMKLSNECTIIVSTRDEMKYRELIDNRKEALPSYETGSYRIAPADSRDEILNVAKRFSNCLASYVDKYATGQTDLYFMTNEGVPEVAIEVKNGCLRQAFQERNIRPTKKQMGAIKEFCDTEHFGFTTDYVPC